MMRYNFEGGSLEVMLRSPTLGDAQQIIGEAADCSGCTRMEGQGGVRSAVSCDVQTCNYVS